METIKDITAEMREFADVDAHTIGRDVLRRRIQHFARRIDEAATNCNQQLAMREMLKEIQGIIEVYNRGLVSTQITVDTIEEIIKQVLSIQPRNCDLYASVDDAWNAFCEIDPPVYMPSPWLDSLVRFRNWLFEEAKGANNEN